MADEILSEDLIERVLSPKRTRTDEGTIEERPIKDMIAADQYARTNTAQSGGVPYGLRIARTNPPGSVSR